MVEARSNQRYSFKTAFDNLSEEERWALKAEGKIADAMYEKSTNPTDNNTGGANEDDVKAGPRAANQGKILEELKKAVQNEATEANKEFLKLEQATQDRAGQFFKQEDFLRHLELGKEFDDNPKYSSKGKAVDLLGFEYCVPPKDLTIGAKLMGRYNIWVAKDKALEEEEELVKHEMSGTDAPFRIEDLQYDVPYANNESYENYYGNIKELRLAEQKYHNEMLNIADSALIIDGNVTFGKTTESADGRPDFERRLSTNSLGDVDGGIVIDKSTRRKVFSTIARRIRRKRSTSGHDEDSHHTSDAANDADKHSFKDRGGLHSVRHKLKIGKDSLRKGRTIR